MGKTFRRKINLLVLLIICLTFTACGSAKVYNTHKVLKTKKSLINIEKEIINAGKSLKWNMRKTSPGVIMGNIFLRDHSANIRITYSKSQYNISYIKSNNLNYSAKSNTIHSNYNGWISNLENTINNFLDELLMNEHLRIKEKASLSDKIASLNTSSTNRRSLIKDIKPININNKSIEQIEKAFVKAGRNLGWNVTKQKEGFMLARLVLRTHTVIVRIDYTKENYSIKYILSKNLDYNNFGPYTIHRNYNGWIQNLTNSINYYL